MKVKAESKAQEISKAQKEIQKTKKELGVHEYDWFHGDKPYHCPYCWCQEGK